MARGEGAIVEDVDGNRFLDCAAGIAVNSTGHSHPEVVAAIVDQAQKFLHMSGTDFYYEPQVRLAEEIGRDRADRRRRQERSSATRAPRPTKRRSSWRATTPKRPFLIAFLGSFHGRTLGSLGADVEPRRAAQGLRAGDHAGRVPRAVPGRLSRRRRRVAGAGRRRVDRLDRGSAVRAPRVARRGRGDRRRADPGRGRLHRAADRVPPAARASWRRSTASCSSSTKCSRAWAAPARCSPSEHFGLEAGHRVDRQGHRVGPAARRHRGPGRRHGLDAGRARQHVRRQPGRLRRRARRRSSCSKAG